MARTPSTMLPLGSELPFFALPDAVMGRTVSASELAGKPAVVIFICNHCPFVKHIRVELARVALRSVAEIEGDLGPLTHAPPPFVGVLSRGGVEDRQRPERRLRIEPPPGHRPCKCTPPQRHRAGRRPLPLEGRAEQDEVHAPDWVARRPGTPGC